MISFKTYLSDLQEMTNASKMNSHHKMGYLDGVMGKKKIDAGAHQKEYDAAHRLGSIHRSKLVKAHAIKEGDDYATHMKARKVLAAKRMAELDAENAKLTPEELEAQTKMAEKLTAGVLRHKDVYKKAFGS